MSTTIVRPTGFLFSLNPQQYRYAAKVGFQRRFYAHDHDYDTGLHHQRTIEDLCWINVIGALSEATYAKFVKQPWPATIGHQPVEAPDVPPDWQVRCSERHNTRMIVREKDLDEQRFVFLTSEDRGITFMIRGWMYGGDAKRPEWYGHAGRNKNSCWWVPPSELCQSFPSGVK